MQNSKSINEKDLKQVTIKLICIIDDKESVLKNYLKIIKDHYSVLIKEILDKPFVNLNNEHHSQSKIIQFFENKKFEVNLEELQQFKMKVEKEEAENEIK